jgi:hypothetical protein
LAQLRVKLKYVLALVQMAVALALLWWSQVWLRAAMRIMDMPGPAPAFTLLVSINAPIALPRAIWSRYLPDPWDDLTLIAAVGLLWYWVALNVDSWRQKRTALMFSWRPLRFCGDLLLIATGLFWGLIFVGKDLAVGAIMNGTRGEALRNQFPLSRSQATWFIVATAFHLAWCLALILFFGCDFVHCVFRKKPETTTQIQD